MGACDLLEHAVAMPVNPAILVDPYRVTMDRRAPLDVRELWGPPGRESLSWDGDKTRPTERSMSWGSPRQSWWADQ